MNKVFSKKTVNVILVTLTVILIVFNTVLIFKIIKLKHEGEKGTQSLINNGLSNEEHTYITFDGKLLVLVKERIKSDNSFTPSLQALKAQADRLLDIQPYSVVNKKVLPPSSDTHDYISLQPYWWKLPSGKYEYRDGQNNQERHITYTDEMQLINMANNSLTLALAYYFFDDELYADKSASFIKTWFVDEKTRMNPNFNYAQVIPGKTKGNGGAMDGRLLPLVMDSSVLIEQSSSWTNQDKNALKQWFSELLVWLTSDSVQIEESKNPNNHGTWSDALIASTAYFVGDIKQAHEIVQGSISKHIQVQIEPDGRQPFETRRTKSFFYSGFNLLGLFRLAALGDNINIDLWNYQSSDRRAIRKALDYLLPYQTKEKTWPYIYNQSELWEPQMVDIYQQASCIYRDPQFARIAKLLGENDPTNIRLLLYPLQICVTDPIFN